MNQSLRSRCRRVALSALILLALGWAVPVSAQVHHLSAAQARQLIAANQGQEDFVILDIRTSGEFAQGHLAGAILIDYYGPRYLDQLRRLDKSRRYLIYCRSGNRSSRTLKLIEKMGFQEIFHLQRGINDWVANRYELVR